MPPWLHLRNDDEAPQEPLRVLIVEDDRFQCESLIRMFDRRRPRIEAECAPELGEALACVHAKSYACVVLDLGLPDSDSMETARRIPEFGDIPVVALTGSDDRELIREVRRHGAGYCLKGGGEQTAEHAIMEKVLLAIERHRPSREVEDALITTVREGQAEKAKPWYLQMAPLISAFVAFSGMTATGGMFLYRSIAEKVQQAEITAAKFKALDEFVARSQMTLERITENQRDLQMKAQTSMEDRAGLHRDLGALQQQLKEAKEDQTRRLERIEDNQLKLLQLFQSKPGAAATHPSSQNSTASAR